MAGYSWKGLCARRIPQADRLIRPIARMVLFRMSSGRFQNCRFQNSMRLLSIGRNRGLQNRDSDAAGRMEQTIRYPPGALYYLAEVARAAV